METFGEISMRMELPSRASRLLGQTAL